MRWFKETWAQFKELWKLLKERRAKAEKTPESDDQSSTNMLVEGKGPKELSAPKYDDAKLDQIIRGIETIENVKNEFLLMLGIFGAMLVFTTVEVQIFKDQTRFSLMLGISSFFIAALMLFVLTLNNIIHPRSRRDYKSAAFWLAVIFLVLAVEAFWWDIHPGHVWLPIWGSIKL